MVAPAKIHCITLRTLGGSSNCTVGTLGGTPGRSKLTGLVRGPKPIAHSPEPTRVRPLVSPRVPHIRRGRDRGGAGPPYPPPPPPPPPAPPHPPPGGRAPGG